MHLFPNSLFILDEVGDYIYLKVLVALRRASWVLFGEGYWLLGAGILGDSFGSLRDGMLDQLSWQ